MLKAQLFSLLLTQIVKRITPDVLKAAIDGFLDTIEDAIEKSETKVDDRVILPLIRTVRETFNVPDNDETADHDQPRRF